MKKYYVLLVISLFACFSAHAQDTIIFRNGDELLVKVTEVSDTEIKYQLWANQSGPSYKKFTSDIFMIKYHNGYREEYNKKFSDANSLNKDSIMVYTGMDYKIGSKILEKNELKDYFTIDEYDTYISAKKQIRAGGGLLFPGIALSTIGTVLYITHLTDAKITDLTYLYFSISFMVVGTITFNAGVPLLCVGNARLRWIAKNYNRREFGVDMSFHPSLISSPDKTGSNNYCYGLGMTLSF